jgi:hypothetical protein
LRSLLIEARDQVVRRQVGAEAAPNDAAPVLPAPLPSDPAGYGDLLLRMRAVLRALLPADAPVLVVSRGDQRLLSVARRGLAWHFPHHEGGYAGHHPGDSQEAIAELESLRERGAQFLALPATSLWWLDHYRDFARHLDGRYRRAVDDPQTCVVYDLREAVAARAADPDPAASSLAERRPLAAVTIICRNYLAQARVFAKSFLAQEPGCRLYLLVVDRLPPDTEVGFPATVIDPAELDIPDFYELCFKYGVVELSTAVKPYLLSRLMEHYGEDEVVYFDPDILVLRRLPELRRALDRGNIVLTPHTMRPAPVDGKRPTDQDIMISGAYNLGFIALRRSPDTSDLLAWWQERLHDGCRIDVANGLFTDQRWIDLAPSLFPSTYILRDPAYNVAFWNLHERTLSRDRDVFLVNGEPAAFCHISGFDPQKPRKLSKHQSRTEVIPGTALAELLERYVDLLRENGYDDVHEWEYGYDRFDNGLRAHPLLRQIYLNLSREERRAFGDPFATGGADSFFEWATRPTRNGGLSRFLQALYRVRYDLPASFPTARTPGRDRTAYVKWARRWGSAEMKFDPRLVRDHEAPAPTPEAAVAPPAPVRRGPKESYEEMVERVRNVARSALPAGSNVLVISKGDARLVDLGGCEASHFPQTEEGIYGGFHPPNSEVAIAHLEALRDKGAQYLVIPHTSLWWLEHYDELRTHLESNYRLVVQSFDTCLIYSLRKPARTAPLPRWRRWLVQHFPSIPTGGTRA